MHAWHINCTAMSLYNIKMYVCKNYNLVSAFSIVFVLAINK